MAIFYGILAIFASTVGSISGMGGGIIIKPVLDAVSDFTVEQINFMSACTVLVMSICTLYRGRNDQLPIEIPTAIALGLGASVGGVLGKNLFLFLPSSLVYLQSALLLALNVAVYFYLKAQQHLPSQNMKHAAGSFLLGSILGIISSFLGIGGGLFHVLALEFAYSASKVLAIKYSVIIIFFSQISAVFATIIQGIPENVSYPSLVLMMLGASVGANLGRKISKNFTETQLKSCFHDILVGIIALSAFNLGRMLA